MPSGVYKRILGVNCGFKPSLETLRKLKESHIGQIPWNRGLRKETDKRVLQISKSLTGKITPMVVREKISKSKTGRVIGPCSEQRKIRISESNSGKNHWTYNGTPYVKLYPLGWNHTFKEQVRFRDGYKCQECGCSEVENGRNLSVHHIDYNKMNIEHKNLISLCISCHLKTNIRNKQYWVKYFTTKMKQQKQMVEKQNRR